MSPDVAETGRCVGNANFDPFAKGKHDLDYNRAICGKCVIAQECLIEGLAFGEKEKGFKGGLTESQRRKAENLWM